MPPPSNPIEPGAALASGTLANARGTECNPILRFIMRYCLGELSRFEFVSTESMFAEVIYFIGGVIGYWLLAACVWRVLGWLLFDNERLWILKTLQHDPPQNHHQPVPGMPPLRPGRNLQNHLVT